MTIPVNVQDIYNEIDNYGDTVTLRTITRTYSDYGDASDTTSDTTGIKAVCNILKQDDEFVKSGLFKSGDKRFFFKSSQANVIRGNQVYHQNNWYEIKEILTFSLADTTFAIEAIASKI